MAQSSAGLFVANQQGSIAKGGNLYFIQSAVTKAPYALAVDGPANVLY
jgi:large exoprotein involved in heme utilization and adhesion